MTALRLMTYLACLAASGLALSGYADFDSATGAFSLHEFNLYDFIGKAGGVVSSALASLAVIKGWGRK